MVEPNQKVIITSHVVRRPDSTYPVIVKPYKLDISQFGQSVRDKMKFTIRNVSDQSVNLRLIAAPTSLMSIELPETIEAGKSAKAVVILDESALNQNFEKSFTFELNDESASRFTVPVKRTVRSPGAVNKNTVAGGGKSAGK